ncbi:hypothetical protein P4647_18815 [Peribacillus frigoritolerans]|uniref:hypothetical protein n=1 Tax=Peribacillus frigoritolerans TaxID=450367 RepID=UPI002E1A91B0|nr:hypothetical protein [Peribacillus frigoritolerans]
MHVICGREEELFAFLQSISSLQSYFLQKDSTANDGNCTVYLRNREYIFEIGDISTKNPDISANYSIYRFFDKNDEKKPNKKPPIYVLVETVGVEPTSRHNGT